MSSKVEGNQETEGLQKTTDSAGEIAHVESTTTTRLSFRTNYLISPLDLLVLANAFTVLGYKVTGLQQLGQPIGQSNVRIEADGQLAQKDSITVDCNTTKQVVGIRAPKAHQAIEEFEKLVKLLDGNFPEFRSKVFFYEITFQGEYRTGKDPLKVFSSMRDKYPGCDEPSRIFGFEAYPFSLKVATNNLGIESEEWTDFTIEPKIVRANEIYAIVTTSRSKNLEKLLEYARKVETKSLEILGRLESAFPG